MMNLGFFGRWRLRCRAREFVSALKKLRHYQWDLLSADHRAEIHRYEGEIVEALRAGRTEVLPSLMDRAEALALDVYPVRKHDALRENIEVVFVAIVAALALRAYFLQPFKIPTGSMEPTLFGVEPVAAHVEMPSLPKRLVSQFVFGRTYGRVVFDHPVTLIGLRGGRITPWFEFTDLYFDSGESRRVWINRGLLQSKLGLRPRQTFAAHEPVVEFVSQTGDQVLVDKVSYNFRLPHRGEVFVFHTTGIEGIESDLHRRGIEGSEFYIKRCVGVPGDTLRLMPPRLEITRHGAPVAENFAMKRVEAMENGYRGYGLLPNQNFLRGPLETYSLDPDTYWAMGDNSYNSLDSRFWGSVPRANLVGTGFIVYWPFGTRWGWIR